jgi:anti-anti-sigma factor
MTDRIFTNSVVRDDEALLVVRGEIDVLTAGELGKALHKLLTRSRRVLVDLAGVTFLGMDGVRVLSAARYRAARTGRSFQVISMSVVASRIFTLLAELSLGPDRTAGHLADVAKSHLTVTVPHALHNVEPLSAPRPMDMRARFEEVAANYHATMVSVADVCSAASSTYLQLGLAGSGAHRSYYRRRAAVMRGRAANAEQCARGAFDPCA